MNRIEYITNEIALHRAISSMRARRVIAVDTETTGLSPHDSKIRLVQISTGDATYVIDASRVSLRPLASVLEDERVVKVAHNAKFDIKFLMGELRCEVKPVFCTMIASKLLSFGDVKNGHSLRDVARKLLGFEISKEERLSDWTAEELSDSQIRYAALDAEILLPIYRKQVVELVKNDLLRVGKIEMDCIAPIALTELRGFGFDGARWSDLLVRKIVVRDELLTRLTEMLQSGLDGVMERNPDKVGTRPVKPKRITDPRRRRVKPSEEDMEHEIIKYERWEAQYSREMALYEDAMGLWRRIPDLAQKRINLNSPDQIKTAMVNLGVPLPTNREGKLSTDENDLLPLVENFPAVSLLLDYRGAQKSVTSYGQTYLDLCDDDGRLRMNINQLDAGTGRMSASHPNTQQVPHDEEHRSCFTAPSGRVLVTSDFSQIELRLLAEFSGDEAFCGAFISGLDLHRFGASQVHRVSYEDVTDKMRGFQKRLNFGTVYGIGAWKFSAQTGLSVEESSRMISSYASSYPKNEAWLQRAARQSSERGFTRTMSGRLQKFDLSNADKGKLGAIGRNGRNMPIQGTSADITKRAARRLYDLMGGVRGSAFIVNYVHDELVVECDERDASWVVEMSQRAMVSAGEEFITKVPVVVESNVSQVWSK